MRILHDLEPKVIFKVKVIHYQKLDTSHNCLPLTRILTIYTLPCGMSGEVMSYCISRLLKKFNLSHNWWTGIDRAFICALYFTRPFKMYCKSWPWPWSFTFMFILRERERDWLFNVTCNGISVIYVTAHRHVGGLKKLNLRSGSQRHRHFVGFFNVPVQAPTRGHPFYMVIPRNRLI